MFDVFLLVFLGGVLGYLLAPYIDRLIEFRNKRMKKKTAS